MWHYTTLMQSNQTKNLSLDGLLSHFQGTLVSCLSCNFVAPKKDFQKEIESLEYKGVFCCHRDWGLRNIVRPSVCVPKAESFSLTICHIWRCCANIGDIFILLSEKSVNGVTTDKYQWGQMASEKPKWYFWGKFDYKIRGLDLKSLSRD